MGTRNTRYPEPVIATPVEQRALLRLGAALEGLYLNKETHVPYLTGPRGDQIEIPPPVLALLRQAVHLLAQGHIVTLTALHDKLTVHEAAELLHVSQPYLINRLLDFGVLPCNSNGGERHIPLSSLIQYLQRRAMDDAIPWPGVEDSDMDTSICAD